jgi:hypothetical protein
VSPILVRPIREQLEHDRIVRLLQSRFRRRYEAGMNPGEERNVPVGTGTAALYPDLVLQSIDGRHRLQAVVEVETGESVNRLEALAQWAHLSKLRAAFHLYVPSGMVDVARRLCEDHQIHVAEMWSYHIIVDDPRFVLVFRSRETPAATRARTGAPAPRPAKLAARGAKPTRAVKAPRKAKPARVAASKAKRAAKPVRAARPAKKKRK